MDLDVNPASEPADYPMVLSVTSQFGPVLDQFGILDLVMDS